MSTALCESFNKENKLDVNKKMMKSSGMNEGERRTLKTLQLSAKGTLIGSEKQLSKSRITVSKKPLKIFQDTKIPSSCEAETQTIVCQTDTEAQTDVTGATGIHNVQDIHNDSGAADLDQEAYDLMVRDPIPESYWRELAEERRLSLAEALAENEMLHQSMEELKEENHNLSLLAGQAEHLASVLNEVLGDEEGKKSSDENDTEESTDKEPATEAEDVVKSNQQSKHEPSQDTEKQEQNTG